MWKEELKAPLIGILIFAVVFALSAVWDHRSQSKHEGEIERQQREIIEGILANRSQKEQTIARMVNAHNAVTDWTDAFSGQRFTENLTIGELAPALVRKDRRPVLVFGSIVDVITQDESCKLELDAKANLVSNIRFWLTCTPAQGNEALRYREEAREEALEEIRQGYDDPESETPEQRRADDREAERMARRGYAFIARTKALHSEEAGTIDDPSDKARFTVAEGRCLELLYVGRDYKVPGGDEGYLRLNTSEDETRARREMETHLVVNKALKSPRVQKELNDIPKE